jgi:hypothetical protein
MMLTTVFGKRATNYTVQASYLLVLARTQYRTSCTRVDDGRKCELAALFAHRRGTRTDRRVCVRDCGATQAFVGDAVMADVAMGCSALRIADVAAQLNRHQAYRT